MTSAFTEIYPFLSLIIDPHKELLINELDPPPAFSSPSTLLP